MRKLHLVYLTAVALTATACRQSPTGLDEQMVAFQKCLPEYGDCGGGGGGVPAVDPAPLADGIWLGVNTGPSRCYSATGAGINDADQDRFDEWCEGLLAQAFRPLLRFSQYDCNVGMEPRWAVKYFPAEQVARVGYLLSYYKDCGSEGGACSISTWWTYICFGHEGDSEFIIADLRFNATTQHWYVIKAFLSAHFGEEPALGGLLSSGDYSSFVAGANLQYPAKKRGYFQVWVAEGKHANYRTQGECNAGAIFGQDTCESNVPNSAVQLTIFNNRNVGSPLVHLIDCTQAVGVEAPFRTRTECYWTDRRFVGWWNPAPWPVSDVNSAMGYGVEMLPHVMENYRLPKECVFGVCPPL